MDSRENKEIIELKPENPDQGEIRYTYSASSKAAISRPSQNWLTKIFGIFFGIGLLFVFIFFFVYVILPVVVILLVWTLARNLLRKA